MKTNCIPWNSSSLVRAAWCTVWILALHWPMVGHAGGLPGAVPTPPAALNEGPERVRSDCPWGPPVAPAVPAAGSTEPGSTEKVPGQSADGVGDPILCACLSIEDLPNHDLLVYRDKQHARA
jgi:hypothetical protein